jgi:hypothetical protein
MEPIPTAEEMLKVQLAGLKIDYVGFNKEVLAKSGLPGILDNLIQDVMIEFAKLHVEAALEAAGEIIENELEKDFLNKDSILTAYPLENIK